MFRHFLIPIVGVQNNALFLSQSIIFFRIDKFYLINYS